MVVLQKYFSKFAEGDIKLINGPAVAPMSVLPTGALAIKAPLSPAREQDDAGAMLALRSFFQQVLYRYVVAILTKKTGEIALGSSAK